MIAPQGGFLPPIHQQNQQSQRNPPYLFYKGGGQQNFPQINKYNQNQQIHGQSSQLTNSNSFRMQNQLHRPESNYQRKNLHFQLNEQKQQNYSPNRNDHNLQEIQNNIYKQNSLNQDNLHITSFPQINQTNQDVQFQPNQMNKVVQYQHDIPYIQQDYYNEDIQNFDRSINNQTYQQQSSQHLSLNQSIQHPSEQLYQQRSDSYVQQPQIQKHSSQPQQQQFQFNQQNYQQHQMQQFYGSPQQQKQIQESQVNIHGGNNYQQHLNELYSTPNKPIQDQNDFQSQTFQIRNNYGSQIKDRKSQSENQRNNDQLKAMRLIGQYSDQKKLSPQHSDNRQELANILLKQVQVILNVFEIEDKRRKQMEEKEKNRLHELSLLNYNLKNSPFTKCIQYLHNRNNRQRVQNQQQNEIQSQQNNSLPVQKIIQPNSDHNIPSSFINNNPYLQNNPIQENAYVPREFMVDIEQNQNQNNIQSLNPLVQSVGQNQLNHLDQFAQVSQLSSIPQVIIAGQENQIVNNLVPMKQNDQVNLNNINNTLTIESKKAIMQENSKIVNSQKQNEKQINQQKYMGYQEFLQQQIEDQKQRKKEEKQKKLEEDQYYEQLFQKQIQEDQNKDTLEKYKRQQMYQNIDKQNMQAIPANNKKREQSQITQTIIAQDIKQNNQQQQNFRRQSSVQSSISQLDEQQRIKKSSLSRSQRSYTSDDDKSKKGTFRIDKMSRIVTQQSQNQQVLQVPQNQQLLQIPQNQQISLVSQNQQQQQKPQNQQILQVPQNQQLLQGPKQSVRQIHDNSQNLKQYNIEENQNIIQFQKGMSDMMNQLTENQQRIQQVISQIKQNNEENTKNTQNQFSEIQKLIIKQQTTNNNQYNNKNNILSTNHTQVQQSPYSTFQSTQNKQKEEYSQYKIDQQQTQNKLLQQSLNQFSLGIASNQLIDVTHEKKQRSSHSVDRQSISRTERFISKEDMNNEPVLAHNLSRKDMTDFLTDNINNNYKRQKVIEKLNEISNDSVFINYHNDSERIIERSQENSISEGFKIHETGQEVLNIPFMNTNQIKKQSHKTAKIKHEENREQNGFEDKSQYSVNSARQRNEKGEKSSLKKSIKYINKMDIQKIIEKNNSRLQNLYELENKSEYLQYIEYQKI